MKKNDQVRVASARTTLPGILTVANIPEQKIIVGIQGLCDLYPGIFIPAKKNSRHKQLHLLLLGVVFVLGNQVLNAQFGSSWGITGNSGTSTANFIGTTDNNPLVFKANNKVGIRISDQLVAIGSHEPKARLDIAGGNGSDPKTDVINPAMAFSWESGGYRHWISTRHSSLINSSTNAIEFYLNNSNTSAGSSSTLQGTRHGMSITAAGVGIGTPSPVANLDIFDLLETPKDNGGSKEMLRLGRTGTSGYKWPMSVSFGLGSYAPGLNPQSKLDIKLGNGGQGNPDVTVMTLAGNGNVAISNQIQIKGGNPGGTKILTAVDGTGLATWEQPQYLGIFGNGNTSASSALNQMTFGYNESSIYMHAIKTRHNGFGKSGNAIDFFVWKQGTDAIDVAGTQHVMTLDGTGYVGIGTKSPTKLLEIGADKAGVTEVQLLVHGGAKFNNDADVDHLTQVTINTNKRIAGIALTVGGPTYIGSYANADASINIGQLKDYYLWVEKGIVSEDYAIANATTWKDEVFTKGYKLPTLGEVEKFIAENKHLPGVPSGKEIKENGYTLHQMG